MEAKDMYFVTPAPGFGSLVPRLVHLTQCLTMIRWGMIPLEGCHNNSNIAK